MASILVTGGGGFIGSNLCRTLLKEGHRVVAIDNLITGKAENTVSLLTNPNFLFIEKDITDPSFLHTFEKEKFDYIYHLACPTGVPNLTILAEEMLRTCSIGTLHVLELAKLHGSRVLYASSAEVYGDPEVFPQTESYTGNADPVGPRSAYEEGKRFSESCVVMYVRRHAISGVIVRIFNTYGPGMSLDDTRVIPQFIKSVRDEKPFRIYGEGTQTRAHLFIDDLLRGLQLVMEKGEAGEAYNVGSATPMTIRNLADLLISLTNHKAGIDFQPHFISDHGGREPSVEKVKKLGWKQEVQLKEGLEKMIATYLSHVPVTPSSVIAG
ncbi:NAD-dependent epimerase/dehydratase family protein [Candidatus Parcubacteria bacterium]|nr:MAG: NAD-dependent epimerase/dehydratase family protein [Candidatus Parcubacteria bacterium]